MTVGEMKKLLEGEDEDQIVVVHDKYDSYTVVGDFLHLTGDVSIGSDSIFTLDYNGSVKALELI